jgi:hypothetical protein
MFKRAGKLGQENEQAMQVPIPPSPGHFSAINFSAKSQQADDATLPKLVPASMSATSPNRGALRAFSMNATDHRGRASDCSILEDVVAASGASDGSSLRAGRGPPPVGDRRPVRLPSSYRARRNVASIRSRTEHGQATGTPGRRCVPGAVAGFDAVARAAGPRFFAPEVRDPKALTPGGF